MHVVTIECPDATAAMRAWVAACGAAGSPPLWVRLAQLALREGWFPSGEAGEAERYSIMAIVESAVALSDVAGAPAGDRYCPDINQGDGPRTTEYATCTGTGITVAEVTVRISGEAGSVLRRAIAAAAEAGVPFAADEGLVAAAIADAREHDAQAAEDNIRTAVIRASAVGRSYAAEDASIW